MSEPSFFLTHLLALLHDGGDRPAFLFRGKEISYRDCYRLLRRLHHALPDTVPGEVVAVLAGNRPETVLVQLAAQLRGARVLLISASSSLPDRLAALRAAGATTLIVDPEREPGRIDELIGTRAPLSIGPAGSAGSLPAGTPDLLAASGESPLDLPSGVVTIFPTGGTTGTPKLIEHGGTYEGMARIFRPNPAGPGRILVTAPMSHMTGNAATLGALLGGDTVVPHNGFDPTAVLRSINDDRITALSLTPPRLAQLLDHPALADTDLSSLRSLSLGAAPLSTERLSQALEVFGPIVGQGYGLTEAPMIATITAAELDGHPERLGSVGRIVPGMAAKIGDDGEVLVQGLSLMDGYRDPALTAAAFTDGWLHTGDIGRFDDDGYLYLLDRAVDVIITGEHGTKVYSTVVEDALARHPLVRQVAVIGIPGAGGEGEAVHAVVVPAGALDPADLQRHARAHFGQEHFVPSTVEFTDALPLTPLGKIDKKALRTPYWTPHPRPIA
ncbi:AMP-binding protein [Amycolatopsis nigrescens]|uniref:AMP-binding protein n=1 Tax=Amycolatopsis nigrescens TaxID=381445 RepID=UPI00058D754E|nr:AMP-binding protein [Amycolatopsis nigrescens]